MHLLLGQAQAHHVAHVGLCSSLLHELHLQGLHQLCQALIGLPQLHAQLVHLIAHDLDALVVPERGLVSASCLEQRLHARLVSLCALLRHSKAVDAHAALPHLCLIQPGLAAAGGVAQV